jgi:hypothetical protein
MFFGTINQINLQLVIETFLASFLIALPVFEKRKHYIPIAIGLTIVFAALGYFFPSVYVDTEIYTILYWTFMYTTLMLFSIPFLLLVFRMKFINALLVSLTSYLIHHINNIFASIFTECITLYTDISSECVAYQIIKWIINLFVLFLTYIIFFYYYTEQRKENLKLVFSNRQFTFFGSVDVIFTIIISSAVRVCQYQSDSKAVYVLSLVSNFGSCLLVMIFFFEFLRHNKLQQELLIEKRIIEQSQKQYELSKENVESLNIKFHDLKYRVNQLVNNTNVTKDDLKDISMDIDIYESVVKTGNKALDVVLTQNALRAENNDIKFTSIADGKALSFMTDTDIYVLFGNAISNAIEATMKLEDKEKRHISIVIKKKGSILSVEVENFFNPNEMKVVNQRLETSKKDKFNHGYGIRSMQNIVRKYDGILKIHTENDIFLLTMTFSGNENHD